MYRVKQALMGVHDIGKALVRRENSKDTPEARPCQLEASLSLHRTTDLSVADVKAEAKRP